MATYMYINNDKNQFICMACFIVQYTSFCCNKTMHVTWQPLRRHHGNNHRECAASVINTIYSNVSFGMAAIQAEYNVGQNILVILTKHIAHECQSMAHLKSPTSKHQTCAVRYSMWCFQVYDASLNNSLFIKDTVCQSWLCSLLTKSS